MATAHRLGPFPLGVVGAIEPTCCEMPARKSAPLSTYRTPEASRDVIALVTNLAHLLRSAKWTSVLPSVIDAAERDPDIADMYSTLQRGYSAPFETVIERAVRKGELPKKTDAAILIAALTGPLFYRRWFSREPVSDAFAKQIVQRVIRQS